MAARAASQWASYSRISTSIWRRFSTGDSTAIDHFRMFGLPHRFLLDESELQKSYKSLMVSFHPDKHKDKPTEEQSAMEEQASQITNAYQVLKSPHTRALHCLELIGSPLVDEETTSSAAHFVGPTFLMEVLEWRESIDQLPAAFEGADEESIAELQSMWQETQERTEEVLQELDKVLFGEHSSDKENVERALKLTAQLQYWNRIEETIREKL